MNTTTPATGFVSLDERYEIERFLFKEARLFDQEKQRVWLDTMVDPSIRYRMSISEERFRNDSNRSSSVVYIYDEKMLHLDLRVRQFETGLQPMLDPPQVLRHVVSNIEAEYGDADGEYRVRSYCVVHRARREYEVSQSVFQKQDLLRRGDDGALRLVTRDIVLGQRVVTDKNLLYFV